MWPFNLRFILSDAPVRDSIRGKEWGKRGRQRVSYQEMGAAGKRDVCESRWPGSWQPERGTRWGRGKWGRAVTEGIGGRLCR